MPPQRGVVNRLRQHPAGVNIELYLMAFVITAAIVLAMQCFVDMVFKHFTGHVPLNAAQWFRMEMVPRTALQVTPDDFGYSGDKQGEQAKVF